MIDTHKETLLTIRQARDAFPGRPSVATLWRWMLKGVRGSVLESVRVGGRRYTSKEACSRFTEETAQHPSKPKLRSRRLQRQSYLRAKKILDHFGV